MFDISFGELLICAVIALLVLGPERLPGVVRTVGRWVGRARHTVSQFTDQIDREIRANDLQQRLTNEIKQADLSHVSQQLKDALRAPLSLSLPAASSIDNTTATEDHCIAPPAAKQPATTADQSVAAAPAGTADAHPDTPNSTAAQPEQTPPDETNHANSQAPGITPTNKNS